MEELLLLRIRHSLDDCCAGVAGHFLGSGLTFRNLRTRRSTSPRSVGVVGALEPVAAVVQAG